MKRILWIMLLSCFSLAYAAKPLHLVTTDWEPYIHEGAGYNGHAYHIVKSAFKAAGVDVKITFMPWKKAMVAVAKGEVDGIFPEYYDATRRREVVFSRPFASSSLVLMKRRSTRLPLFRYNPNQLHTLDPLADYTFGSVSGYTNLPAFDKNLRLKKWYFDSDKENLKNLYNGKVDLAIIDKNTADFLLSHALPAKYQRSLVALKPVLAQKKLYVAFTKSKRDYRQNVRDFNRGLERLHRSGDVAYLLHYDKRVTGRMFA